MACLCIYRTPIKLVDTCIVKPTSKTTNVKRRNETKAAQHTRMHQWGPTKLDLIFLSSAWSGNEARPRRFSGFSWQRSERRQRWIIIIDPLHLCQLVFLFHTTGWVCSVSHQRQNQNTSIQLSRTNKSNPKILTLCQRQLHRSPYIIGPIWRCARVTHHYNHALTEKKRGSKKYILPFRHFTFRCVMRTVLLPVSPSSEYGNLQSRNGISSTCVLF
jgi:hypothetical protein